MVALPRLKRLMTALRRWPWGEIVGPALIVTIVTIYFRKLLSGDFPVSHDHPAHLFNAWLTSDVLIPRGELRGWSDLWFAGYPANDLYGPGGSLWVCLFRWLTFGRLTWGATYGLAMWALLVLVPMSAYVFGRAFVGRTAGLVAGLCLALTKGSWYDLGWFWILEMGVWPFALGAALTLIALSVARGYLLHGGARRLVASSLWIAASLVGHPMSLIVLGLAGPVLVGYVVLERGREATRPILRAAGALVLAVGLCASWLIPFITKSSYSQKLGETWLDLGEVLAPVAQLNLLGTEWRLVMGLSVVGLGFAIARRQYGVLMVVVLGATMALLASTTVLYQLRLFDILPPLASIQYPRFLGIIRVLCYVVAGYATHELWRLMWPTLLALRHGPRNERLRGALAIALPVGLMVPFLSDVKSYFRENHTVKDESLVTRADVPWWGDFQAAVAYLNERLSDAPWSRIGAFGNPYDHVFSLLPVLTGRPVYSGGYVPAHTYVYFFDGQRDAATLEAVGVRYVLAMGNFGDGRKDLKLLETFGNLKVYVVEGLRDAEPRRVSAMGRCTVTEEAIGDETLVFSVTESDGPCRVRIHRADYPNWTVTYTPDDGAASTLPIERVALHAASLYPAFMSVEVPGDGAVVLKFEDTRGDVLGFWLSAVSWLGLVALVLGSMPLGRLGRRRDWWLDRVRARLEPGVRLRRIGTRITWVTFVAVPALLVVFGFVRARERVYTFDRHVKEAEKVVELGNDTTVPCRQSDTGPGWRCTEPWDRIDRGLYSFTYDSRYCIYLHPSPAGEKHLRFKDVPLRRRLSGFFGLLDSSQGTSEVTLSITVGDNAPVSFKQSGNGSLQGIEVDTEEGVADVDVSVVSSRPEWRHACFNLQAVD